MAGELGHVHIPLHGLLEVGQPLPDCNCGFAGDAESVASLTGIEKNLLPYWLSQFPDHELAGVQPADKAAQMVRSFGARSDPMAWVEPLTQTGAHVSFRERVTWTAKDGTRRVQSALGVYEVRDGKIKRAWYFPSTRETAPAAATK